MIVWTDIESTNLDERVGHLLEVAFVVTDDELRERASTSVAIRPPDLEAPDGLRPCDRIEMPLVVREMHEKSGLLADVNQHGRSLDTAAEYLNGWLASTFGRIEDLRQIPLAGSTVAFDRRWLRHHMPAIEALFSYRSIDVSALTELAQRWNPNIYNNRPKKDAGVTHRALADAQSSIEVLRYYHQQGFVG